MQGEFPVTELTRVKRGHQRATYDKQTIYDILDATRLCHIAYIRDGRPAVLPTLQWREGDHVYWHGSSKSKALLSSFENEVCMTVTLLDGMVLARSAFHHSVNYRSVMIYGMPVQIKDEDVKAEKLKNMVDTIMPGRWEHLRPMTAQEVKGTAVLSMPLEQVSAKVRACGPVDDEEDYELPIWAGVVPIKQEILPPVDDERLLHGLTPPEHIKNIKIG